jgi:hypothetical protein
MSPEFKGLVGLGYFRPSANISGCRVFRVSRNSPRPSVKGIDNESPCYQFRAVRRNIRCRPIPIGLVLRYRACRVFRANSSRPFVNGIVKRITMLSFPSGRRDIRCRPTPLMAIYKDFGRCHRMCQSRNPSILNIYHN